MCNGDMTLEDADHAPDIENLNGPRLLGVKGWGITHQCKSWNDMFNFSAQHRVLLRNGIDR